MAVNFLELIGATRVNLGGLHQDYRRRHLLEDYTLCMVVIGMICIPLVSLVRNDFRFLGHSPTTYLLVAGRITELVWAAVLAWTLRRAKNPRLFDIHLAIWTSTASLLAIAIQLTRPADYLDGFVLDVLFIMLMFMASGIGWPWRTLPPVLHTFGSLYALWGWKHAPAASPMLTITVALLLALGGGYVLAGRMENYRRRQFLAKHREARARSELESSLNELREARDQVMTLSGLLPICANCKKVRDDKGYWQQIEYYVSHHSDARFSHGLCPECIEALYPEYADADKNEETAGPDIQTAGPGKL